MFNKDEYTESILKRFVEVVKGERHRYYEHTRKYAERVRKMTTGDVNHLLERFSSRETVTQFELRKLLTRHVVKSVISNFIDTAARVDRVRSTKTLEYLNTDSESEIKRKERILKERIEDFSGDMSVTDYVKEKIRHYQFFDPNSWVVLDFQAFDANVSNAEPYPIEYLSEQVVDYRHSIKGKLEYLTVCEEHDVLMLDGSIKKGSKFTLYGTEQHFQFVEIAPNLVPVNLTREGLQYISDAIFLVVNTRVYAFNEFEPHGLGYVPAVCTGYDKAVDTNLKTFKAFYDGAIDVIEKSIKINSELDVILSQMAHPYVVRYIVETDAYDENREVALASEFTDIRDHMANTPIRDKNNLPNSFEEIVITIPENAKSTDILDPQKMIAFINPPLDAIKSLDDLVQNLIRRAKEVVFNSDLYTKKDIAETATKATLSAQAVNDKLYPLANHIAETCEFIVRTIARLTDTDKDLIFEMSYSEDLKLKGADAILEELAILKQTGAGNEVMDVVSSQLMETLLDDQPQKLLEYNVKKMLNPLSSKTPEERIFALSSPFVQDWIKVAYLNFDAIFSDILQEVPTFYQLSEGEQRAIFRRYADRMMPPANELEAFLNVTR